MIKVLLAAVLAFVAVPSAHAGFKGTLLDLETYASFGTSLLEDAKNNTGFKVESAMPFVSNDWQRGKKFAGTAFPVFHVGSYWWAGGALSKDISNSEGAAQIVNGFRLNAVTRPLVKKLFNGLSLGNIDKIPFLDTLAESTSVGITAGHDFSYVEKKKVVFNTYGLFLGVEILFGPKPANGEVTASGIPGGPAKYTKKGRSITVR